MHTSFFYYHFKEMKNTLTLNSQIPKYLFIHLSNSSIFPHVLIIPFYKMVPIFMQTCRSLSHLMSSLDFYFFHKLCSFLHSAFQQNSWEEFMYLFVPNPLQLDSPTNHHFYQIALSGSTVISSLLNPVADS